MIFAIPFMFLVPVGVVVILAMVAQELLHPSKGWKFMGIFLPSIIFADAILRHLGYSYEDQQRYTLGATVAVMLVLWLLQSWRWLTPFWILFVATILASCVVGAIIFAILGVDVPSNEHPNSTLEWYVIAQAWICGIASAAATIWLNMRVYNPSVQEYTGLLVADAGSGANTAQQYLDRINSSWSPRHGLQPIKSSQNIQHDLLVIAAGIMQRHFQWVHYPSTQEKSPELELARIQVPREIRDMVSRGELKSGDLLFLGFGDILDEDGFFTQFLLRVRLNGVLFDLADKCIFTKKNGQWGYTFGKWPVEV